MSANYVRLGADEIALGEVETLIDDESVRRRIESWLGALMQADHLSLLIGNGLSRGIGHAIGCPPPSMSSALPEIDRSASISAHAALSASNVGRDHNLEDEIRSALALIAGLDVLGESSDEVRAAVDDAMAGIVSGVFQYEAALRDAVRAHSPAGQKAATLLQRFLLPFATRGAGRDRLSVFTTNYDRTIEFAADLFGMRLIDRFVGQLEPVFSASRLNVDMHYSPPGIRNEPRYLDGVARFSKLHGSVDWQVDGDRIVRKSVEFGALASAVPESPSENVLIYPNPAKDVETLAHPYAELFRDFASALCQPNSVLITFGYGFGDTHINRVIRDMLRIHSTHLVVASFDDLATLDHFKLEYFPANQTTELIGPALGDVSAFTEFIPSSVTSSLLEAQAKHAEAATRAREATSVPTALDEATAKA